MLEILKVLFRREDFVLTADLEIPAGRKVSVIGPSGSGKSTLLSIIAGFDTVTEGDVFWKGTRITRLPPGRRPVSILFQDNNLFPHLTVAQNVGLGRNSSLRLTRSDQDDISRALDRVGLGGLGSRKPAELSGGQQGRAALARTLLRDRPVLLLDEPFAALGPGLKAEMLDLVTDTAKAADLTVILVTHDPEDAERFSDVTVVVSEGVVASPVETRELFRNPPAILREYIGKS